jgi:hypothetical protein
MDDLMPLTTAALRRLRISWHRYRFAVHESKCIHHLVKVVALKEQSK